MASGPPDVHKEFDHEIKGNIFCLKNQRLQLPPNPSQVNADFHNTGGGISKKGSVAPSLNVVHQFLVFQLFVPQGETFFIELHVRDKGNVSVLPDGRLGAQAPGSDRLNF